jgi:hypothetical protein
MVQDGCMKIKRWWMAGIMGIAGIFLTGCFFSTGASAVEQSNSSPVLHIGLMGDSTIDEYRGTANRGGDFASVTFNWLEQLVRERNISAGGWGDWDEPRRTGYEYNWARSAATASLLLEQKQPEGLAQQVADGKIDLVIMAVGNHDFAPYNPDAYQPIYDGTLTDEQVTDKVNGIIANETTAVDMILAVKKIPIIITTIVDFNLSLDNKFSDPDKRQRVTNAVERVNAGLKSMANDRGIYVMDMKDYALSMFSRVKDGMLVIGDVQINPFTAGDDPHNGLLGDNIHAGTVLGGFIANSYLALINEAMGTNIPAFTDQEILMTAGLSP